MRKLLGKHKEGVIKYLVTALLILVPLYPKFPLVGVPGTYVSVRLEDFVIFGVGIIWLICCFGDIKRLLGHRTIYLVGMYLVVGLLSLGSAIWVTETVRWHIGLLHWVRRVEYMFPLVLGLSLKAREEGAEYFGKVLMALMIVVTIVGFGQKNFGWPIVTTQNFEYSKGVALRYLPGAHIPASFAGHYDLASFLVLTMPVVLMILLEAWRRRKMNVFVLGLVAMAGGNWLLVNAASRISLVTYMFGVGFALLISRKLKLLPVLVVALILFATTSSNLLSRYLNIFKVTLDRIVVSEMQVMASEELPERRVASPSPEPVKISVFEDRSTSIRFNIEWPRAVRAFAKNPLLGTGYSSISLATDNDYLRALGETGAVGLLAFLTLLVHTLGKMMKFVSVRSGGSYAKAYVTGLLSGVVGALGNGIFIDIFEASKFATIFWLMVGLAIGISDNVKKSKTDNK